MTSRPPRNHSQAPRVSVVILNWNGYEDTRRCIESARACGYSNLRIFVVDNASADGSGGRLKAEADGYEAICNSGNLGFARGCNVGIRAALRDPECAYILLLNNDATVEPGGLEHAVARAEASRKVGLVGGKILHSRENRTIWSIGGEIDFWRGQAMGRGPHQLDEGQFDAPRRQTFITGALMLIPRNVLEAVGLLPEEYFFGQEEWDYSVAVHRAGFELWYEPKLLAYHSGDGSHSNSDPKFVYNSYRNKLIFQQKYLPKPLWKLWMFVFEHLYAPFLSARTLKQCHPTNSRRKELAYALHAAIRDHRREGIRQMEERDMLRFAEELASLRNADSMTEKVGA